MYSSMFDGCAAAAFLLFWLMLGVIVLLVLMFAFDLSATWQTWTLGAIAWVYVGEKIGRMIEA